MAYGMAVVLGLHLRRSELSDLCADGVTYQRLRRQHRARRGQGTLLLIYGAGAIAGPLLAGPMMRAFGASGLSYYIGGVFTCVGLYAEPLPRASKNETEAAK